MANAKRSNTGWTLPRLLPWLLLIGGAVGAIASAILTVESINIAANPKYVPVCNLSPIFSCSSVNASGQASIFGFPNQLIGLAGYSAMAAVGAALLAGAQLKRWFWQGLNLGLLMAIGFVSWLQFEALYRIGSLCIFCMVVWAVTIPVFWYLTLYNLREGHIATPNRLRGAASFAQKHHGDILLAWFLLLIGLILKRFWYYWNSLI